MKPFLSIVPFLSLALAASGFASSSATSPDAFEADRRAILAMAGEYRVHFHFRETVALQPGYALHEPHDSGATEFVDVIEDTGDRIVLQHVLVLHPKPGDTPDPDATPGETADPSAPRVVKHWRQDWQYQPAIVWEYAGDRTWTPRAVDETRRRGAWAQSVWQVDDSPRYASVGTWSHAGGVSAWEGNDTWRPLPRREFTTRDDYDVLIGRNRHTLTPDGWLHEQDNAKLVTRDGRSDVLCREIGHNTYTRLSPGEADFAAGREYWSHTDDFWADVRSAWSRWYASGAPIALRGTVDGKPMFRHLFEYAQGVHDAGRYEPSEGRDFIAATLAKFRR